MTGQDGDLRPLASPADGLKPESVPAQPNKKELGFALELHKAVTAIWPSELFLWDRMYFFATDRQREGFGDFAARLYKKVLPAADRQDWVAWIHYKLGEVCLDAGRPAEAHWYFRKALELCPGHVKAEMELLPEGEPLAIVLGEKPPFSLPARYLPMDVHDLGGWLYYCKRRTVDTLYLYPPRLILRPDLRSLRSILTTYLSEQGRIVCCLSEQERVSLDCATLRRLALRGDRELNEARVRALRELSGQADASLRGKTQAECREGVL